MEYHEGEMLIKGKGLKTIDFGGLRILDYTAGMAGPSSSFAVIEVAPGAKHARAYSKRSDKYYYGVSGSVRFVVDGREQLLPAGDMLFIAQGRTFFYVNDSASPAQLILVHTPSFDLGEEVFLPD